MVGNLTVENCGQHNNFLKFTIGIVNLFPERFLIGFKLGRICHCHDGGARCCYGFLNGTIFGGTVCGGSFFAPARCTSFRGVGLGIPIGLRRFLVNEFNSCVVPPSTRHVGHRRRTRT